MARPNKYTEEIIIEMIAKLDAYVTETDIPIVAEFAYKNNIPKRTLYDLADKNDELLHSIKVLVTKKEAQLERLGLTGAIDKTMAVFSLKQLGWKDKNETEHTGAVGITIIDDVRKCKKD